MGRYQRISRRRGAKRAAVAVAHSQLTVIYEMLKTGEVYREMGSGCLNQKDEDRLKDTLVARLERMGYKVNLQSQTDAA